MAAIRLIVMGRVQGVGFRAWTLRMASQFGVKGWVRNRADGAVEIVAGGPQDALDGFAAACRQGPRHAQVAHVMQEEWRQEIEPGFTERPTL